MRKTLIVVGTQKESSKKLLADIQAYLKERGFISELYTYSGEALYDDSCTESLSPEYDFAISFGGDGTVLFTARYCAPRGIPVFPINLGHFGFIASIEPDDWKVELDKFLKGEIELHERHLLSADIDREGKKNCFVALNDLVISGSGVAKLINLNISFNGTSFGVFRADGIIVSTPTGSTAYSAGLGGPILDPGVPAFLLTPIAPFSLSNRPIVLPSSGNIEIEVLASRENNILLSIDGQEVFSLDEGDTINISESAKSIKMAGCSPASFYKALRSKLGWSGNRS